MLLNGAAVEGAWNFGPTVDATLSVQALVLQMQALWPVLRSEPSPGPHPREAPILLLNSTKAARELEWRPIWNAGDTLKHTMQWYYDFYNDGQLRSDEDLNDYVAAATAAGLAWAT